MVPLDVIGPPVKPTPVFIVVIVPTMAEFEALVMRPCESMVMIGISVPDPYVPAVTAVFASEMVPLVVIGPPIKPTPVFIVLTVPTVLVLVAAVMRPCALTVIFAAVYEPAVTPVFDSARLVELPKATKPPPVNPVLAVIVMELFANMAFVIPALGTDMVPLLVIGPPVKPAPVLMDVIVPAPALDGAQATPFQASVCAKLGKVVLTGCP